MQKYYKQKIQVKDLSHMGIMNLLTSEGYPGNIWVTENTAWAARHGLVEMTKMTVQTIVNTTISGSNDEDGNQIVINLP